MHLRSLTSLLILLPVAAPGCATTFGQRYQQVTVHSEPEGAEVFVNGHSIAVTPVALELDGWSYDDFEVVVQAEGYLPEHFLLERRIDPLAWLDSVFLALWAVDVISGAITRYDPTSYLVELVREEEGTGN